MVAKSTGSQGRFALVEREPMKTASFIESRYSCGAHHEDLGPRLGPSGEPLTVLLAHKLRRVNERVDGYEPGGRTFEWRTNSSNYLARYGSVNNLVVLTIWREPNGRNRE
jgi:hypothetical protein